MRRPHTRLIAVAALAALTTGGLTACTLYSKTFQDDAKVDQKITSVRLDNRNGTVKVNASAGTTTASVHRKVHYRGDKPGGTSFSVKNGVLTLAGCGSHCSVDYAVEVPAGLPVTGGTSNGGVTLTHVGTVDVHTSNGRITVNGATGPVTLHTSNGSIDVNDAKGGDIDVKTSNGKVAIATSTPQNIKARTSNGSLTVTTPPAAYRISAHTSNGSKKLAFKNTPSAPHHLDLTTTNGSLTIKPPA